MSVFIRQNFSYSPEIFLSETLNVELPKNLVICFRETLAPLLLDATKTPHSCLLLLDLKQRISTQLLKLQIIENHLKPPKAICKHPKPFTIIQNHPPKNICNHPKPTITTRNHPQSARIYLEPASCNWSETIHFHVRKITIIQKIFETNSSFHMKWRTSANIQYLFFRKLLLVLTKLSFWEED